MIIQLSQRSICMAAKTTCTISRKEFEAHAKPIKVVINGEEMESKNRQLSTGSVGWNISSKMRIKVGDKDVTVQVGLNLTIVGSKDLPNEAATPAASHEPALPTSEG